MRLTATAPNVALVATPGNGVSFQWRAYSRRRFQRHQCRRPFAAPTPSSPLWLQLTRSGNVFTASYSTNGTTYTVIGSRDDYAQHLAACGLGRHVAQQRPADYGHVRQRGDSNFGRNRHHSRNPKPCHTPPSAPSISPGPQVSGTTTYNFYRSTTSGGEGTTPYLTGLTGTTYSDTAVTAGTPYYYKLTAVNSAGQSRQSTKSRRRRRLRLRRIRSRRRYRCTGRSRFAFNSSTGVYTVSGGGADIWLGGPVQLRFDDCHGQRDADRGSDQPDGDRSVGQGGIDVPRWPDGRSRQRRAVRHPRQWRELAVAKLPPAAVPAISRWYRPRAHAIGSDLAGTEPQRQCLYRFLQHQRNRLDGDRLARPSF